jgi:Putative restriction endonuclease
MKEIMEISVMATIERAIDPLIPEAKLERQEFLRRFEAMPDVKNAELIGGIVYMPSPVSRDHGVRDNRLSTWLGVYAAFTPGCEAADNSTWLMADDAPQPDTDLRIRPEYGGASTMQGRYVAGAPELLAEISTSSGDIELGEKMELYRSAGVREYMVLLVPLGELRWYQLVEDLYHLLPVSADGVIRSHAFPGLWLDVESLLDGNMSRVLEVLQQGLQSSEHAAFVGHLGQRHS